MGTWRYWSTAAAACALVTLITAFVAPSACLPLTCIALVAAALGAAATYDAETPDTASTPRPLPLLPGPEAKPATSDPHDGTETGHGLGHAA